MVCDAEQGKKLFEKRLLGRQTCSLGVSWEKCDHRYYQKSR
jgi:hypothetical protein